MKLWICCEENIDDTWFYPPGNLWIIRRVGICVHIFIRRNLFPFLQFFSGFIDLIPYFVLVHTLKTWHAQIIFFSLFRSSMLIWLPACLYGTFDWQILLKKILHSVKFTTWPTQSLTQRASKMILNNLFSMEEKNPMGLEWCKVLNLCLYIYYSSIVSVSQHFICCFWKFNI